MILDMFLIYNPNPKIHWKVIKGLVKALFIQTAEGGLYNLEADALKCQNVGELSDLKTASQTLALGIIALYDLDMKIMALYRTATVRLTINDVGMRWVSFYCV